MSYQIIKEECKCVGKKEVLVEYLKNIPFAKTQPRIVANLCYACNVLEEVVMVEGKIEPKFPPQKSLF